MTIYDRIAQRLEDLELSARKACEDSGLGESFIRDLKRSKARSPRVEGLEKLAPTLKTNVEWLRTGRGDRDKLDAPPAEPPPTAQVIGIMPRLRLSDQAKVAEYARRLAKQKKRE